MFLAQCGVESAGFTRFAENLNYSAAGLQKTFPVHFKDARKAAIFAHNRSAIGNLVYANRMGNGDAVSGDGYRYRGRGIIQLTGRANFEAADAMLGTSLLEDPDLLLLPEIAARVAVWYFTTRMPGIRLADAMDLEGCTKCINGGLNGLAERRALYDRCCTLFGVSDG